ncbi:MAG TPA: hypothetical protein PKJ34_10475, partial [Anaerolineaceae bacterium]|nr:hypothetical protein [Anaerolineaceae bacterium]
MKKSINVWTLFIKGFPSGKDALMKGDCVKMTTMQKPRIIFMGSPEFAVPILQKLMETYPVVGVVTQP